MSAIKPSARAASWLIEATAHPELAGGKIDLGREPHQIGVALGVLGEQSDAPVGPGAIEIAAG